MSKLKQETTFSVIGSYIFIGLMFRIQERTVGTCVVTTCPVLGGGMETAKKIISPSTVAWWKCDEFT